MSGKKPSAVASIIVLVLVLALLGGIAGGGFWAYNKFMKKPGDETGTTEIASENTGGSENSPGGTPIPIDEGTPTTIPVDTVPVDPVPVDPVPVVPVDPPEDNGTIAVTPVPVDPVPVAPVAPVPTTPVDVAELPTRTAAPAAIAYATDSPEGMGLVKDALQRVDEAPGKTSKEKERAKKVLREAKKISKVATVYFQNESNAVSTAETARLATALKLPEVRGMTRNGKAICFALGFADKKGSAAYNKALSMKRAQAAISSLEKLGLKLSTTAIAIGPTELVDKENQGKNRAAEVWVLIP